MINSTWNVVLFFFNLLNHIIWKFSNYLLGLKRLYYSNGNVKSGTFLKDYFLNMSEDELEPKLHTKIKFRSDMEVTEFAGLIYYNLKTIISESYLWNVLNKNQRFESFALDMQVKVKKKYIL